MTGDGTNDAPALAAADVGVAMNSGTAAAKEAGNMVDLDSDPTKLIDIVEIGKQLLITRGALTTFSIANDVAKYFAIIPAMFVVAYPSLDALNVMGLATPQSAILSAVIFNALVIVALIPLALRGVRFRAASAHRVLRRNMLVFGLGGMVVPVRRHQAHRPRSSRTDPWNRLTIMLTDLARQCLGAACGCLPRPHRHARPRLSRRGLGRGSAGLGDRAAGQPVSPRRRDRRQPADGPEIRGRPWFHSRPSANDYDSLASGGPATSARPTPTCWAPSRSARGPWRRPSRGPTARCRRMR